MPARWKTGLVLLALSMAGPLGAQPFTAQAVISQCASHAAATLKGLPALSSACPGLRAALEQLALTPFLPPSWPKTLTAAGLADASALTVRYAGSPVPQGPRTAALRSIAAGLVPPPLPRTWWDRVKTWIRQRTAPLRAMVTRWLRSLGTGGSQSQRALAVLLGVSVLLLATVVVVLTFELRGSGLFRRRIAARPPGGAARGGVGESVDTQPGETDWPRLREQPARVLRLLVDALTRSHRLGRDRHLTCRELEAEARLDSERERAGFACVARLAERELYGPPGATVLAEETLQDVKMLHARLLAAAAQGRGARQ